MALLLKHKLALLFVIKNSKILLLLKGLQFPILVMTVCSRVYARVHVFS